MRRGKLLTGLLISAVAIPATLFVAMPTASAAAVPECGAGYKRVARSNAYKVRVVLYKKNLPGQVDSWCAYTRRMGSRFGNRGYTDVHLLGYKNDRFTNTKWEREDGQFERYAGPIYTKARCARAMGVTEKWPLPQSHQAETGMVC